MKKTIKKDLVLIGTGLMAGAINGFFGAGSGLVLVPMLKWATKLDDKKVHATTLACVFFMCLTNVVIFLIHGQIKFSITIWCLIGSVFGAIIGTILFQKMKNKIINIIFDVIMIMAGVLLIVQ